MWIGKRPLIVNPILNTVLKKNEFRGLLLFDFKTYYNTWVAGQVPGKGHARGNQTLMFLSLFPYPPPSLKINK